MRRTHVKALASVVLAFGLAASAFGRAHTSFTPLRKHAPDVVSRSMDLGRTDSNRVLHLAVSLPYGDPDGIGAYADSVSDPLSPNYRHFLTPEEVGARFGLADDQVQSVVDFLEASGFKINLVGKNHLSILAEGTVSHAERAFNTSFHEFQALRADEPGNTRYFSFTSEIKFPAALEAYVQDVTGLENFTKPQLRALTPTQTRTLYDTAPMYSAAKQGQGRTLAISNFDGFRLTNVPLYYTQYGLPAPTGGVGSNITVVKISGGAGTGTPQGEGDLDIQMVLGMAPLCAFRIYDGGASDLIGVLTAEVNDNLADVISESYGWNLPASTATSAHNLHLSMTAQGITYMAASGDSGTTLEPYSYPDYEPEVLSVGGTIATVNGSGVRTNEVAWSLSGGLGGGGGWSTNTATFNVLPSWQHGTNVPTTNNHRLVPDVALHAGGSGAYNFYLNGALSGAYVGTSFASPVFAGSLGVVEQQIISQGGLPANGAGKQRFGRIQDLIYAQNGRADVWHDITSGSIGTLPNGSTATAGTAWDYATGWGAIDFNAFVATQVSTTIPAAPTGLSATAGNAQVGLTWSASSGASSYNVKRATVSGGPYTTVASSTTTSYTNTGLTNGTTYYYVVTAVNTAGESGNSNQASATPNLSIPAAPTGLTATSGNAQIALAWTASSGATSYNVKRATVSGGPYTTVASPTTAGYTNTGLTNGTTYYYVVTAVNGAGESGNSNQASATPAAVDTTPPTVPTGLTATSGPNTLQITLHWTASTDANSPISYEVHRANTQNGTYTVIGTVTATAYTDTLTRSGRTRWYYLVAIDPAGNRSANSAKVSGVSK